MAYCNEQYFALLKVLIFVIGVVIVLWKYIDNSIKMDNNLAAKSNKVTARVKAAGCTAAFVFLQIPYAKTTLDVIYYGIHIDLYTPINIGMLIATIYYGIITGGTFLTNIKGNAGNGNQQAGNNDN